MTNLVHLEAVGLAYPTASGSYAVLHSVDLSIAQGEHVAIVGRSGSGKSSLLHVLTGIERPTTGRSIVAGQSLADLKEGPLALWRGRNVGIVFQFFQLIPTLTVLENLLLPMEFVGSIPRNERRSRALSLLEQVGIADQALKVPATLSGGEQQRAALARALANDPPLIVADEPTGNLDSRSADRVNTLFSDLVKAGKTVIIVTHERQPGAQFHRIVSLEDGRVVADQRRSS